MTKLAIALFLALSACSSGSSSSGTDCAELEREIHDAAVKRGYDGDHDGIPDSIGICEDQTPAIKQAFGQACAQAASCH